MNKQNLLAVSPIDGRYGNITQVFSDFFSEYALIKARVFVEIEYFLALYNLHIPQLKYDVDNILLRNIYSDFSLNDALRIKEIEKTTNHDVKAVEYFLKEKFDELKLENIREFVHFGLTSQDINNTAIPWMLKQAVDKIIVPEYQKLIDKIDELVDKWHNVPMLAHTHGQAASPTTAGKELKVFAYRLNIQIQKIKNFVFSAKFGGATGNFNAHLLAYPKINWQQFADDFVEKTFGLQRSQYTTQIDNYDNIAEFFHCIERINTVLLDFSKDMWTYISMEYISQKIKSGEVGSSAMPHKVNPIDFENAEGNLGLANAILSFMASKLPVSRLQRDLSDSTVLRNIGVPLAHSFIAVNSLLKGLSKIEINKDKIIEDLDKHWEIIAEGVQTILRREGFSEPYELMKNFTRGKLPVNQQVFLDFIENLNVDDKIKNELKNITPSNYIGYASQLY
jgi:adenylosuccinate lyase